MLAFYTIRTKIDIITEAALFERLLARIGNLCQPEILGTPFQEEDEFVFRFAVRPHGLERAGENDIVGTFGAPFDHENTQLVLAARL